MGRSLAQYKALLAAALLFASAATAGEQLDAALSQLADGFRASSAARLRPLLPRGDRVYLAVPAIEPEPGFLGADQIDYLLRDFFERHPTRSFAVTGTRLGRTGSAFVDAAWSYALSADVDRKEPLRITLVERDGRWAIHELRTARN